jgi:NAD(P)-dependent dehydrogenase (short-subunit alcohol dehydrogenase family)
MPWTSKEIPSLSGKNAIVTGANIGLGLEIATQLASHGAHTVLACRNPDKAKEAMEGIKAKLGNAGGSVEAMQVDCGSLESVKKFVGEVNAKFKKLDILVLNAGVMAPGERSETVDGFELQLGVNVLAPFVTVAGLLPLLESTDGSRVVFHSSSGNYMAKAIPWDDLQYKTKDWGVAGKYDAYGLTKLYDILLPNELQRRLDAKGKKNPSCMSAHPGLVIGQLQDLATSSLFERVAFTIARWVPGMSQSYEMGALPVLYAATSPDAKGGRFCKFCRCGVLFRDSNPIVDTDGPDGISNGTIGGYPKELQPNPLATDAENMKRFFEACEQMTGIKYKI